MKYRKMLNLSDRLLYIRRYHNLTQSELAELGDTSQQSIQQAEKGKAHNPRYLHKLAKKLKIPVDWIMTGDAIKEEKTPDFSGFDEKSTDVLKNFFSMPKKDQELIQELMKSRKKKK